MGRYGTLMNQSIDIDAAYDILDSGWSISGGAAIHESCNAGLLTNNFFASVVGQQYKVEYTVSNYVSGKVYAVLGGVNGVDRTADGRYVEYITATDISGIKFWSNGDLWITGVRISSGVVNGRTIVFNEKYDQWAGERSYIPEFATKFLDDVFVFRGGQVWLQEGNELRNNFFGEQFTSQIKYYVNLNPTQIKNFYSMRLKSNKPWDITEIRIVARDGKSEGQLSRIKKGNFRSLQGDWFADFLKDMNDPRFADTLDALFNGADLQGGIAEITMVSTEVTEIRLVSVDVEVAPQSYTY